MMIVRQRFAPAFLVCLLIFAAGLWVQQSSVQAQEYEGEVVQELDCNALASENRKLAMALADTTQKMLETKDGGGACEGMEALKEQNQSLRDTIKAQNDALISGGGGDASEIQKLRQENKSLQGLKDTIRQLQAQNGHLSAAGNMGKTVTNQVLALQEKIDKMKGDVDKEKQNSAAYREKIKEYEATITDLKNNKGHEIMSQDFENERLRLSKEITALQLENQELKARIDLLQQKSGK